jgi:hypothetical protein
MLTSNNYTRNIKTPPIFKNWILKIYSSCGNKVCNSGTQQNALRGEKESQTERDRICVCVWNASEFDEVTGSTSTRTNRFEMFLKMWYASVCLRMIYSIDVQTTQERVKCKLLSKNYFMIITLKWNTIQFTSNTFIMVIQKLYPCRVKVNCRSWWPTYQAYYCIWHLDN